MQLARKLKTKAGARKGLAADGDRLKAIAAQFENDPDLKEAAARVQALADALLADPALLVRSIEELFDSGTIAELLRMAKALPDNMPLHASIAAILSFCADSKEHATEIGSLGGNWFFPHGCRYAHTVAADEASLVQLLLGTGYVAHMAESSTCMLKKQDDEPCTGVTTMVALMRAATVDADSQAPAVLPQLLQCMAHLSEDTRCCAALLAPLLLL